MKFIKIIYKVILRFYRFLCILLRVATEYNKEDEDKESNNCHKED